jgi:hypothetical protein
VCVRGQDLLAPEAVLGGNNSSRMEMTGHRRECPRCLLCSARISSLPRPFWAETTAPVWK